MFKDTEEAEQFVEEHFNRLSRNRWERYKRMIRRGYTNRWNFFCTYTYDSQKHTEDTFRSSLMNTLYHLSSRRDWRYIGAWERGELGERLHFHALTYIPEGAMPGELEEHEDYSTKRHRREKSIQNSFFNERFGRNYIEVGQYIDYIFPAFSIRFIAIQDNVDTENRDSNEMEMMPIMNIFNEWHAANTSKKIRAVLKSNARDGKYHARKAPYGYVKSDTEKKTPIIDEEAAAVVKRIFEMRASGLSPHKIADILNAEGVLNPSRYCLERYGVVGRRENVGLWSFCGVNSILQNPTYLGHMVQQRDSTVSYKNHKRYVKDESEWITVYNTHEPIITQELWDKVREVEKSVAQGRKTKRGYTHPLSGFLFCADCGGKMKLNYINRNGKIDFNFNCGNHMRIGKAYCFSHFIQAKDIEAIVLDDIRAMAQRIVLDEKTIRDEFIRHNAELADKAIKSTKKELQAKRKRTEELSRLMQLAYEDRLKGKMPEDICIGFIQKYSDEQNRLENEIAELEERLTETTNTIQSADEFIRNIKKYLEAPELTREMCYELLDRVVVGGHPKHTGKERVIDIVYKVDIASVLRYKLNNPNK